MIYPGWSKPYWAHWANIMASKIKRWVKKALTARGNTSSVTWNNYKAWTLNCKLSMIQRNGRNKYNPLRTKVKVWRTFSSDRLWKSLNKCNWIRCYISGIQEWVPKKTGPTITAKLSIFFVMKWKHVVSALSLRAVTNITCKKYRHRSV
jgi:hypothetical protein